MAHASTERVPMTPNGLELLKTELDDLKNVQRPVVTKAIAEAREHGDLKENAEYHAAKEQQGLMEARIAHIESSLSQAQVIDVTKFPNQGRIIFGSTIKLINTETEEKITYQIVGVDEADIKQNKISVKSPIARSIIGKSKESMAMVKTPGGDKEYEIADVLYV
ncbi:MAG: transcription elongation factor GreA [Thiotrichales bacterium]|nr:MAG: transcription elongation factor GreA [Thiotrichales bacterium]